MTIESLEQVVEASGKSSRPMKICVVIPALNEEATIGDLIGRIPRRILGIDDIQIIVVDDGSSDRTAELGRSAGAHVVSHGDNRGVGVAFQTGVEAAIGLDADLMVNMDGDGQFDPDDIPRLVEPILEGKADFVSASRFLEKAYYPEMPRIKIWGNLAMSRLISFLTGRRFHDVSCGFRAYSRDTLLRLNLFGDFTYTQETFMDLSFRAARILEVPVRVRGTREFGKSRVASNLFHYAFRTSKIIFRSFRDYRPMLVFGLIGSAMLLAGFGLLTFLVLHYLQTGLFSPHKWAGFAGGFLSAVGLLVIVFGLQADMLDRSRINQERILYLLRKKTRDND